MKPTHFLLLRRLTVLTLALAASSLCAQTDDPPVGVAVKIFATGYPNLNFDTYGTLSLSGTFLSATPGGADEYDPASGWSSTAGTPATAILGSQGYVRVVAAKSYTLAVSGYNLLDGAVNIVAPPGYRVVMDDLLRTRETFDGSANIVFQLLPLGARHPGLAGMASSVSSTEIEWRLSLGSLLNGGSAGDLALIDTGTRSDWSAVYTPGSLYYEPTADEISVYRPNGILQQIYANQVAVDIVTLSSTSFEIRCYHPSQMSGSNPCTFTGQAYATYRIEKGNTATSLKFTKEIRNVLDATTTTLPVARREIMTLARTGTWPAFTWTKSDWTLDTGTALTETDVTSSGTTAARSEAITIKVPGTGGAVALNVTRNYTVPLYPVTNGASTIGEVLSSETVGTGTNLTASFNYYTDPSQFGSLGFLQSATLPGGGWVAYDYYDTDPTVGYSGGRVKHRYKPYGNLPAAIPLTRSPNSGEVTYYEYTADIFGAATRPSLVQTTVNGTMTAKTTTAYNDTYATANGFPIGQSTRSDSSDASNSLQTIVRYYRDDTSDAFVRGQTYSVTKPDGVMQSFAYERGTWSGTAFTQGTGYIGTGTASRVSVVTGTTGLSSATTPCSAIGTYQLDTVNLVSGKSTKDVTIRDSRALVVRTESYMWDGSWELVASTNYTYDYAGRLLSRVALNGATYTAAYDGGLKTTETDEAGVTTNYTYDAAGQVSVSTRVGVGTGPGAIGSLATHFVYDAAGHVTQQQVGWTQTGLTEQIVTSTQYDDAGRVTVETPSGGLGATTHSYDAANRTQTTTRPGGGGTIVETANLDGSLASRTGTAVVAEYHSYGANSWMRGHTVNYGTATSPRWKSTTTDGVGRVIETDSPGFTGQPTVVESNYYQDSPGWSSTGHLIKTTKTGFAPTLYQYNVLGQVSLSGLDYDNSGTLDLASSDRLTASDYTLEGSSSAGFWRRDTTSTYTTLGINAVVTTSTTRTRLTGFPANRLSETQTIDAEGNTTTQTVDVNRTAATSTATTTKAGVTPSQVETTVDGFSTSIVGFDGLTTSTTYDALLRKHSVVDTRGNATTIAYLAATTLPITTTDAAGDQSATSYDTLGRVNWQRDARAHYTFFEYNPRDQVIHQWGDGAMPVAYGYDATYGDRTTLSTFRGGTGWDAVPNGSTLPSWPSAPGTADTTTWTYDAPSGLLWKKTDAPTSDPGHANGMTVTSTYNLRGQTATRTLARGAVTTYNYDAATGELLSQTYSDSTPAVSYTYGRTGQVLSVTDFTGTRTMAYDPNKPWRFTAETESGFYGNKVVSRLYDATAGFVGRVNGLQVGTAAGDRSDVEQTFGFTTIGRFQTVSSNRNGNAASAGRTFRYAYRSDSALLQSLSVDGSAFTISRGYEDHRDVITSVDSQWSTVSRSKYAYASNELGQRTSSVQSGTAFSDYGDSTFHLFTYDARGEVTADVGYLGSDVTNQSKPLPGRRHEFAYDNAENRQTSNRTGVAGLADTYTANALNQYTARTNDTLPVSGTAAPDTTPAGGAGGVAVAVEGRTVAAGRQGNYWSDDITVPNVLHPWRGPVTIFAAKRASGSSPDAFRVDTRMAEIAAGSQTLTYDNDGNLSTDGLVAYTYDAENRLVTMETDHDAYTLYGFPHKAIDFRYDYMGRRVQKRVVDLTDPANPVEISSRRYLYDGWNVIAEYAAPGGSTLGALLRSYTWGLDIALSLTNAGGVGALLQIADHPTGKTYLPTYDGNGNIVSLLKSDTTGGGIAGDVAAVYEYGPFGEPLRAQTYDATIADNPFRFSTKWTDLETGLIYYGHRYYDPHNGRFINKDPIEEQGGLNLYGFCRNNAVNSYDVLGMDPITLNGATLTPSTGSGPYIEDNPTGMGPFASIMNQSPDVQMGWALSHLEASDPTSNLIAPFNGPTGPTAHMSEDVGGQNFVEASLQNFFDNAEAERERRMGIDGGNSEIDAILNIIKHGFPNPSSGEKMLQDAMQAFLASFAANSTGQTRVNATGPNGSGSTAFDDLSASVSAYDMGGTTPSDYTIQQVFTTKSDGTDAVLYQSLLTGNLILSFRGTNATSLSDWIANIANAFGLGSDRYKAAVSITQQVQMAYGPDANITLTGHSLGGGQAALASAATGLPAVTFNAAGVNPATYGYLNTSTSQITNYSIIGEPLTTGQLLTPFPNALGTQVYLWPVTLPTLSNALNHGVGALIPAIGGLPPG